MSHAASDSWLKRLADRLVDDELRARVARMPGRLNELGYDDWGFDPDVAVYALAVGRLLHQHYFRVASEGIEHLPAGRMLLVANHGGQIPIDGFMLGTTVALEAEPPRAPRGMVERWVPTLPFLGALWARCGQIVGTREDCIALLERDEAVMVFPEGVRGSGKTLWHAYELQQFGHGFMRIALATRTPIVPVGIVGHEEAIPSVAKLEWLAKLFKAPYVPLPLLLPLLGPLAMLPMPTKYYIQFGKPLTFDGSPDDTDAIISQKVDTVREAMRGLIQRGLERRSGIFELDISARIEHLLGRDRSLSATPPTQEPER